MHTIVNAKIIKTKDCGMEVYRLLVFKNGSLSMIRTHMSEAQARYQWDALKGSLERQAALEVLSA